MTTPSRPKNGSHEAAVLALQVSRSPYASCTAQGEQRQRRSQPLSPIAPQASLTAALTSPPPVAPAPGGSTGEGTCPGSAVSLQAPASTITANRPQTDPIATDVPL